MDFLDWLSGKFGEVIDSLTSLLPKSPIVYLTTNDTISDILSYVNWFIPIYLWISILEGWLTAVCIYYIVQVILRWVKIIE